MIPQPEPRRTLIGTQLYVWSQVCRRDGASLEERLETVFAEAAAAGFEAVEPTLSMCATPEMQGRLRAALAGHQLQAPSFYTGGAYHEEEGFRAHLAATLPLARLAAEMGCRALCIN